jgi:hypothetical protein
MSITLWWEWTFQSPTNSKKAMEFIETKVTKKEFIDIENAIYDGYVKSERTAFEQGFMRGIVVAKGGVV